jgi:SAM-dependent methyltransferase
MQRPPSWSEQNAAAFQLDDVVELYCLRAPYPSTLSPFLRALASPPGGAVLELGCGTGSITRDLAPHIGRIDAVDSSRAMIERARTLPGGNHPSIRWIEGRAEEASFDGPYCLVIAGASLHWMDWDVVLPRVAGNLNPEAVLAIVVSTPEPPPWNDQLREIWSRYSVIQNWENADLIALLESRGLYKQIDKAKLPSETYSRTIGEYIDAQHATSSLPRERMGPSQANAFDHELRELVTPYARGEVLELAASAEVDVGHPLVA